MERKLWCGYFGFILGFLIVKCMAQDVTTTRKPGSENTTEEMDNFRNNTEYWNKSTQLGNGVTERTDSTVGTQTAMISDINSTGSNISNNDTNFSPFIRIDSTTSNDSMNITKQENASNSIDESSTDISELEDLLNASTSMLPTAVTSDSFSAINVNENVEILNRTMLSTDVTETTTNMETETSESHNLLSSSDSTDNAFSGITGMITSSSTANSQLNDTISVIFSSTVETVLAETGTNSTYSNENNNFTTTKTTSDISVSFETSKLSSLSLNETETTRTFEEDASRESSATSLDNGKTSESQVDFENTTDQITHRETAELSKTTIPMDHSSSDTSSDSVNVMFHQSTNFGRTDDVIDSTVSPSTILSSSTAHISTKLLDFPVSYNESTADDKENSTELFPFPTPLININATSSPDDTAVTSTEDGISKTPLIFSEDINNVTEMEGSLTEKLYGSTIFELTKESTSTLAPSVSAFITKYNGSDIISTASTLSSLNDSTIEFTSSMEERSTIPPSLEVSSQNAQSTQEFIPTTISSPTVLERNDSSMPSIGLTDGYSDNASMPFSRDDASSTFMSSTNRLSTEEKTSSIRPSPGLSTLNTVPTTSDGFTTTRDSEKMNESSTPFPSTTTQKHFTSIADSASSLSSRDVSASEFMSTTTSTFSTEGKTSSNTPSSRARTDGPSTPSSFSTSYSTSIPDSTSTSSLSEFTNTTSKLSTEEEPSSTQTSSSTRTESTIADTFPIAWTIWKITESSTSSSFKTTQKYSTSISYSETFSTMTSTTVTPTYETKKVSKCLANATEMEPGNVVTVFFDDLQQEVKDDDNYEIRFQQSALACFDAKLHLIQDNKNDENIYSPAASEDKDQYSHSHFDSTRTIVCASPAFSPKGQNFSITFYVREFVNGSENAISAHITAQAIESCKSKIEEEVGLNITGIFEKLQVPTMPTKEDTHEESILQRHASLFISLSLVIGLLLIFGTVAFVYFYCCNHSRHYDTEKKKLKQDMSTSVETGDMISANEILNGEIGEKEIFGLSNGSSAHLIKMEDDGWVVPYSEIPLEDKNPPDVQDTKL